MSALRGALLSVVVVAVVGTCAAAATFAAFSRTTSNGGDSFAAGTVQIGDNDAGAALLSLTNALPSATDTGCIRVTYTGTLSAGVHLYGAASGGLAPYLTLTVTRGTDASPSFDSCATFVADGTNYIGQGTGVVYSGLLSAYPSTYAAGIVDAPGAPSTWTNGTSRSYKFTVTLNNDPLAVGQSATASFTFEARNQ